MQYQLKPNMQKVDAIHYESLINHMGELTYFLGCNPDIDSHYNIIIKTKGGVVYARKGNWIVKNKKGQIFPCDADIFKETYEKIED